MKKNRINPYNLFVGSFIPNWLLKRPEVSCGAKLVYARLAQFAGKDGKAFPLVGTIAAEIGAPKRNVERFIAELKKAKLIEVSRRGFTHSNSYYFLAHRWMLAEHDPPYVADQDTPPVADHDASSMADIRESEEENQRRDKTPLQTKRITNVKSRDSEPESERWNYSGLPLTSLFTKGGGRVQ